LQFPQKSSKPACLCRKICPVPGNAVFPFKFVATYTKKIDLLSLLQTIIMKSVILSLAKAASAGPFEGVQARFRAQK